MRNIIVKFDLEATHQWSTASDSFSLLRAMHSHIFHFECYIPVVDPDRELEFLLVRRTLIEVVQAEAVITDANPVKYSFGNSSCEMIAEYIAGLILSIYSIEPYRVVVMEDTFVGGEWLPEELDEHRLVR